MSAPGRDAVSDSSGIDTITSSITRSLASFGAIENLTLIGAPRSTPPATPCQHPDRQRRCQYARWGPGQRHSHRRGGTDQFLFDTKPNKTTNADHLTDFLHKTDILLDDDIFKKLDVGKLHKSEFFSGNGVKHAHDDDDRVVYNTKSGKLYYDKDGEGGHDAKLFAILDGSPDNISAKDFLIIV